MVKLLAKIFIKDYNNVSNQQVRTAYGTLAGIFGIITNLILVILKLVIGFIAGAISIIADAINNLSDMGSSIITIFGFKISGKPADKEHPFGHQRMEYVSALIVAIIIAFVGLEVLSQSIQKVIAPSEINTGLVTYIVLGVAIAIKVCQGLFYVSTSKIINSISLKASSKDSFNDCISTSGVIIGIILSNIIGYNLDGILGIMVSIYILISAVFLIKDAINPLIGEKPDKELLNKIIETVKSHKEVLGIHDMIAHLYGPSRVFISLHCEVDSSIDILDSHEIIDEIEHEIKTKYDVDISIHMDPIVLNDMKLERAKATLNEVLSEIDDTLRMHDFRFVAGKENSNLIFDIVIPYDYKYTSEEIVKIISEKVKGKNKKYTCVINVDHDYIGE